eukprot:SM000023S07717  [mRNA]  locus=s23:1048526:1050219:- [translate_table: standard]
MLCVLELLEHFQSAEALSLQVTMQLLEIPGHLELYALTRNQQRAARAVGIGASRVKFVRGDVTDSRTLQAACMGKDAVICCLAARAGHRPGPFPELCNEATAHHMPHLSAGWRLPWNNRDTPKYVDYLGVANLAKAAAEAGVPKFILTSCLGVTRMSLTNLILNVMKGRVMHWKFEGEQVKHLYTAVAVLTPDCIYLLHRALKENFRKRSGLSYYIVRPGGLNNKDGGQEGIMVSQGDRINGRICRKDVASVLVGCLEDAARPNVTFEVVNDKALPPPDIRSIFTQILT